MRSAAIFLAETSVSGQSVSSLQVHHIGFWKPFNKRWFLADSCDNCDISKTLETVIRNHGYCSDYCGHRIAFYCHRCGGATLAARVRLPYSVILAILGILIGSGRNLFFTLLNLTDALNPVAEAILGFPIRSNVFLYVFLPTLAVSGNIGDEPAPDAGRLGFLLWFWPS